MRDYAEVRAQGVITREVAAAALDLYEVDAEGLDRLDRAVLEALLRKFGGGPVGLSTLAVAVGEEPETVEIVAEPFLVRQGLLARTPAAGWRPPSPGSTSASPRRPARTARRRGLACSTISDAGDPASSEYRPDAGNGNFRRDEIVCSLPGYPLTHTLRGLVGGLGWARPRPCARSISGALTGSSTDGR